MDIAGALRRRPRDFAQQFNGVCTDDDGRVLSVAEVRQWLEGELAKGHRVVPMSSECVGFDYQKGCPGHLVPDPVEQWELVNNSSV